MFTRAVVRSGMACRPTLFTALLLLTACGNANSQAASDHVGPCDPYACQGPGAVLNVAYPFQLPTHCGVLEARFDGRAFYVESLYPADLPSDLDQPIDTGTMVLVSTHRALFHDPAGHEIHFVDSPPGVIGQEYPFTVHVLAGGNQTIDERFAGRVWHPEGTLAGVNGPPYGNGHDAYTVVRGSLILLSEDRAVFTTPNGASVAFARVSVACD